MGFGMENKIISCFKCNKLTGFQKIAFFGLRWALIELTDPYTLRSGITKSSLIKLQ